MTNVVFKKYDPTPGEKHMGIVTFLLDGKYIVRQKIVATKDGQSFFPTSPSVKLGDQYLSGFQFDSNYDREEAEGILKAHVKSIIQQQASKPLVNHQAIRPEPKLEEDHNLPF